MSARERINGHPRAPPRVLERVVTYDARIPLSADDPDMEAGWRCIPIPATDDGDWFVLDDNSDRKTVWARWVESDA
jgi:hypothetical protein